MEVRAGRDTPIVVELLKPSPRQDDWVIRAQYVSGGVASILEAWEAVREGVSLRDYALTHPHLRRALDFFGGKHR